MAGPTNQEILDELKTALLAAAKNQSYSVAGRTYTRQNIAELRTAITEYEGRIARETRGGISVRGITPTD
jgi:hypothetical protein